MNAELFYQFLCSIRNLQHTSRSFHLKKKKNLLLDFRNLFLKRNLKEYFPNIVTHSQKKKKFSSSESFTYLFHQIIVLLL